MQIRKAQRRKAALRLGISAPSGAGKTFSALKIAFGLGGKVGLIDTEHGSADLYAHLGDYDVITLQPPFTVDKYRSAINAFEEAGYQTIIIDSLSHAWAGEGGLLDKQSKIAARTGNSYTSWREVTPDHNSLVESMLQSPCHIIATMRTKTEYVIETSDKGKQSPRKVGLAPVQRDGMEYEFTVVIDIDMRHVASASKDRTGLFDGQYFTPNESTGKQLREWLEQGEAPPTLDVDVIANHLKNISEATDTSTLKGVFTEAYLQAESVNDTDALKRFTSAKDARKAALTAEENPL